LLQAGRLGDRVPMMWISSIYLISHIMALGSSQPPTETSTRNLPEGKGWPAHKAGNLTAICELTT
jgi:hypothetical protein